jgi:putative flippase GtrA
MPPQPLILTQWGLASTIHAAHGVMSMDETKGNDGVVLVIPAHQPDAALPDLVAQVMRDPGGNIRSAVVVDDGNEKDCARTFDQLSGIPHVTVLRHGVNLGVGAALKTAYNHVLVHHPNAVGVVSADADLQHAPEDIVNVAKALAAHPHHVVLGVRSFGGDVPFRSRFGNIVTRYVFRLFTGYKIRDTQTGLRGLPLAACGRNLRVELNGFDYQLECLLRAREPFLQVPVQTIYLNENRSSHFNPVRDSMRIYFLFLRYCGSSILATAVDWSVFYPVFFLSGSPALAQVSGRAAAVCANFFVLKNVVFRSGVPLMAALAKYLALVAGAGFLSYTMLQFLHLRFGFPIPIAKIVAESLLFLGNFSIQRDLIFTRSRSK